MGMETAFDAEQVLAETIDEVQQHFSSLDDLAHGWEHVQRVYKLALYIAEKENADRFVVGMAALLHDTGRAIPQNESDHETHHADLSVKFAGVLLQRSRVPLAQQEAIKHAIIAHSFSRGLEPHTLEARIVRDADRLDGLGAIGILRWAITGAIRRSPATRSYHPGDPFGKEHTLDDAHYMLDHFYIKLLTLAKTMTTQTGRELAQQRTDFMRLYLEEFRHELM